MELRDLPSVDELARGSDDPLAVDAARAVLERAREEIRAGAEPGDLSARLRAELQAYGYRFERDSDTEVLLRAYRHWKEDVVDHLRGMFAFAIWDARRERLFLARDRFGEKPLFLQEDGPYLYFASEIKALLELPNAPPTFASIAMHLK